MSEFASEPIKGLPERLPAGEVLLWQGQPSWRGLALRAFHVRKIAIYFGLLLVWRMALAWRDGNSASSVAESLLWLLPLSLAGVGIAALLAWLYSRTAVFTITNRRVVMRYGVALPWSLNLPYSIVRSAAVSMHRDGTADIPPRAHGNRPRVLPPFVAICATLVDQPSATDVALGPGR
jgi:hypothetical protein